MLFLWEIGKPRIVVSSGGRSLQQRRLQHRCEGLARADAEDQRWGPHRVAADRSQGSHEGSHGGWNREKLGDFGGAACLPMASHGLGHQVFCLLVNSKRCGMIIDIDILRDSSTGRVWFQFYFGVVTYFWTHAFAMLAHLQDGHSWRPARVLTVDSPWWFLRLRKCWARERNLLWLAGGLSHAPQCWFTPFRLISGIGRAIRSQWESNKPDHAELRTGMVHLKYSAGEPWCDWF